MVRSIGNILTLLCLLQLVSIGVVAQPFHIEHLGTEHGLSQGSVYAMLHDSRGFMWFGTQDGLNRYDGTKFVLYRPEPNNPASILDININQIIEGPDKDLWIGTEKGISRYLRKHDRFFNLPPILSTRPSGIATPLWVDEGVLWYWAQNEGLVRFDLHAQKGRVVNSDLAFRRSYFTSSEPGKFARDGALWFLMEQGLARIDTLTGKTETYFVGGSLPKLAFNCLIIRPDGHIWLGDSRGLLEFDPQQKTFFRVDKLANGVAIGDVYDIDEDIDKTLWISTDHNGLLRFKPGAGLPEEFTGSRHSDDRLMNREISSMYIDKQGVFWVNTDPVGIDKIVWNPGRFDAVLPSMASNYLGVNLESNSVRGLLDVKPGILWLGTQRNGILEYNSQNDLFQKESVFGLANGLPSLTIRFLFQDSTETIWVGTPKGLSQYNPQKKRFETYYNTVASDPAEEKNFIRHIDQWDANQLLIATESGGYIFDKQQRRFGSITALSRQKISLFYKLSSQKALVGIINKGLYELNWNGEKSSLSKRWVADCLPTCLVKDEKRGVFWIGTDLGLIRYDPSTGQQKHYTEAQGLANAFIYGILLDQTQNLWFSTNRGLSSLNPESENVRNFGPSDGLQGYEFNGYSFLRTADGEMFFGGTQGINRFRPERIRVNTSVPTTQLTNFYVHGQQAALPQYIGELEEVTLRYDENTLAIGYVTPDFLSGNQNRYRHRLVGLDDQWTDVGNQQMVRYFKIPPGSYTFEVMASNNDGIWNNEPTRLRLVVNPPFWQEWWFRLLLVLSLALLMYAFYRNRINQLTARQKEALALVTNTQEMERKHLANELHDDLGVRLSTLNLYLQQLPVREGQKDMVTMLKKSITDIRQLIRELNPRLLFEQGLRSTLDEMSQQLNRVAPPQVRIQYYDFPETLPDEIQLNLFRIAQELINNGLKHAQATHIDLQWFCRDDELILSYEDDGKGFEASSGQAGFGIQNLRQRVALLKGTIEWDSAPNAGVRVMVVVPFLSSVI